MREAYAALKWTRARLIQHLPLVPLIPGGVWYGLMPEGTALPAIVMTFAAPPADIIVVGGERIFSNVLLQVMAHAQTSDLAVLLPITDAMDAVLHNVQGSTSGTGAGLILQSTRERQIIMPPQVIQSGETRRVFLQAGGEYRIFVQAA